MTPLDRNLHPRDGWLPVALPDGTWMHVHVNRDAGTVDLLVRETADPGGPVLEEVRGIDAGYLVVDVAPFVRAALSRPSVELVP